MFLVVDGEAEFVPVRVGITGEQYFEVLEGCKAEKPSCPAPTRRFGSLSGGDAVRVPEAEPAARK